VSAKAFVISVLVALGVGFGLGIFIKGHHEAAKAAAAEQQIKQLGQQVQQEMATRQAQAQVAKDAQTQADAADAKAQKLAKQLASRPKPAPVVPVQGQDPTFNTVTIPSDPLKDSLIASLQDDVAKQKILVLDLKAQIATDNTIIDNQAKEITVGKIALDAQIAANRAGEIKGGIIGGGAVGIMWAVIHVVAHL